MTARNLAHQRETKTGACVLHAGRGRAKERFEDTLAVGVANARAVIENRELRPAGRPAKLYYDGRQAMMDRILDEIAQQAAY